MNRHSKTLLAGLIATVAIGCGNSGLETDGYSGDNTVAEAESETDSSYANPTQSPDAKDSDGDGLSDADEALYGTNPNVADSDGDGLEDGLEVDLGANPLAKDSDSDGMLDASEAAIGTDPATADAACGMDEHTASLEEKPVDIIVVIDNSGSMGDEIRSVQENINKNFADIIRASGLDFRVIMLSQHGNSSSESICVSQPLSGADCSSIPGQPQNTANFFQYDVPIGSRDSLRKILDTYDTPDRHGFTQNGWSEWLRPGAFKVFVEITDDQPSLSATEFEERLFGLSVEHFGGPGKRNYIFHSIIGMAGDGAAAVGPMEDIVSGRCPTGVSAAPEYQKLSIATGGLRYPVCAFQSYDLVFNEVAEGIIEQSKIGCELELPEVPEGEAVNVDAMALQWKTAPDAEPQRVELADAGDCTSRRFSVEGDRIVLCPTLCAEVEVSTEGELSIFAGCGMLDECVPTSAYETDCTNEIDNDCDGFLDRQDIECLQ